MARKLEPGQYTMTDISSGMAVDLRPDNQGLIAYPFHGEDNQQWEFCPCGTGFIINSVRTDGPFFTVRDLSGLYSEGSTEVVPGSLPMCWEVEILPVGPTDPESDGVFARIRLPYTDGTQMTLGFRGSHQEAPLSLGKDMYTFWRLRPVAIRHEKVVGNRQITANETIVEGGGVKKTLIKTVTTTTRTVTRVVPGDV